MTDFFHEWHWQGKHMHALYFSVRDGQTYCPICGETYIPKEKRKLMNPTSLYARDRERNQRLQTTSTTNTLTLPEEPKQEKSLFAQIAFTLIFSALGCLLVALGFALASITVGVITGITLAGFFLLTSISLGILSLRENV